MSKKRQIVTEKAPDSTDRAIAMILVQNPTWTDQEIASKLNLSRATINRRRSSSRVMNVTEEIMAIPKYEIRRVTSKAFRKLEELIDDLDPRIALQASLNFLKLGIELREELKGSNGRLLGLTPMEGEARSLELQIEADRIEMQHRFQEYQIDIELSARLRDAFRKQELKNPKAE